MAEKKYLRCVAYTRVSTETQAEREYNSCATQEERIKSFIKSNEMMKYVKTYSDEGWSGSNTQRPALQALLRDVSQGKYDLVLTYKLDRLTRSQKDFYNLIEVFEQNSTGYISVTERFDTSTPSGRLLRSLLLMFGQFERELTSERTRDKMIQRAEKGMYNGGSPTFGYDAIHKRLVVREDEARVVRMIFEKYVETGSVAAAYNMLKERGIKRIKKKKTPEGEVEYAQTISKSHLFCIVRNPVYIGKMRHGDEVVDGQQERIISDELFAAAQALHKDKKKRFKLYRSHVFAGLVQCHECGHILTP